MDSRIQNVHNVTAVVMTGNQGLRSVAMNFGTQIAALFLIALPLSAGTLFTVSGSQIAPMSAGTFGPNQSLTITATGTVDLLGRDGSYPVNPDGSLVAPLSASCMGCFTAMYQSYVNPGSAYPTVAGGDGTNHFAGGGANFDLFPGGHSVWAPEGKQTTDTTDPLAIRLGALAYTFVSSPQQNDWKVLAPSQGGGMFGNTINSGPSGGTLLLVVVDTAYWNNTGSFSVNVTPNDQATPEPSAAWLAFSGVILFGLPRIVRRRS
jgi:hypothetical protein